MQDDQLFFSETHNRHTPGLCSAIPGENDSTVIDVIARYYKVYKARSAGHANAKIRQCAFAGLSQSKHIDSDAELFYWL